MKPIIVDLKDISDSTEVYDSKPNRFVPYTIYIICAILAIADLDVSFQDGYSIKLIVSLEVTMTVRQ